jgi:hypothetical protein
VDGVNGHVLAKSSRLQFPTSLSILVSVLTFVDNEGYEESPREGQDLKGFKAGR